VVVGIDKIKSFWYNSFTTPKDYKMNSLDKILASMRSGKYGSVIDPKGNAHVGIINAIMREDGSGKNWIVTVTNKTVSEKVFIHAT
jgi:cytoplasmic iron level regulating protein YaaA (DUF328/UPF0246 family)